MSTTPKPRFATGGGAPFSIPRHGGISNDTVSRSRRPLLSLFPAPRKKTALTFNLGTISTDESPTPSAILPDPGSTPIASDVPQPQGSVAKAKRPRKKQSKEPQESPPAILLSVQQGAQLLGKTSGAVRHMIFNAEAYQSEPSLSAHRGFLECIVRPPGERRVFLHREKLLALIESWARNGDNKEGEK